MDGRKGNIRDGLVLEEAKHKSHDPIEFEAGSFVGFNDSRLETNSAMIVASS
jgi:hypothetical protein